MFYNQQAFLCIKLGAKYCFTEIEEQLYLTGKNLERKKCTKIFNNLNKQISFFYSLIFFLSTADLIILNVCLSKYHF